MGKRGRGRKGGSYSGANGRANCCGYKSKKIILPLLATLSSLKPDQRTFMLAHLDEKSLRTLCTTVDKVLHANLPHLIESNLRKRLLSNKDRLRRLCRHESLNVGAVRKNLMKMGSGAMRLVLKNAIPLY